MSFSIALTARLRRSPFWESTVAEGVRSFSIYNHMNMPVSYGDPAAEYDRLINGVAMWDVSCERQVALKGPDALELARLMTPRNLDNLEVGMGKYVPMVNSLGTLINDPILLQVSENEIWLSIADSDMKYWADGIATVKGFDVTVYEPDVSPLAIQGPKAVDVVAALFGDDIRTMRYFAFEQRELDGIPLLLARSGWSKQGGFELYLCDGTRGNALWDKVREAGAPFGIGPGAPSAIERVESGLISIGTDTDDHANAFEMGLGKFIDLDQETDFIGKRALRSIKANGIKRQFCGLVMDGEAFPTTSSKRWTVTDKNGEYAGYASASAFSPRLGKNIGVALIKTELAESGAALQVETEFGTRGATATTLPFAAPNT